MAVAGDVPHKFDVVINGEGYMLASPEQRRAVYGYSPTFVQRTNVQGDYGDNQQDFWLTASQNDWSGGEGQRFFRTDENRRSRYWQGRRVFVADGAFSTGIGVTALATAAAVAAACPGRQYVHFSTATNLYQVTAGTITDRGAHGLGATPSRYGMTSDGANVFISSQAAGIIRKWDGAAFSTFAAASGADSLLYHNNSLYGLRATAGELVRYDTVGAATVVHTWQEADGSALDVSNTASQLIQLGGKIVILLVRPDAQSHIPAELWSYDGTGVTKIAELPIGFLPRQAATLNGMVAVIGVQYHEARGGIGFVTTGSAKIPSIWFYVNGTSGFLWEAPVTNGNSGGAEDIPALVAVENGLAFIASHAVTPDNGSHVRFWDAATGAVHSRGTWSSGSNFLGVARQGSNEFYMMSGSGTTSWRWPPGSLTGSEVADIYTSLFDFDSSLDKVFRGVKVVFDRDDAGDVDIAYRLNDLDNVTYTTLQAGAVSGTEYALNQTGSSISIRIRINYTNSTGPIVRRLYIRAAPVQQTFKLREYVLDLTGRNGESHVQLRNDALHPKDGLAQAADLNTAATTTAPITITDRFGTFTGIIDSPGFELTEIRPEEFIARVRVREV